MRPHLLLIDPEDDDRITLRLLSELYGFRVDEADDGRRGLDLARSRHPDVVILDLLLPGIDGFAVAEQIRSTRADGAPFVIAYTALHLCEVRAHLAGCDHFIVKPDMERLIGLLQRLFPDERLPDPRAQGDVAAF